MRPEQLILRCFLEREPDGQYFAACIDLNLYARGDTDREAVRKLHSYIVDYVRSALTDDKAHADDLLPRPAPWAYLLRYHWIALRCRARNATNCLSRIFTETLPMVPAA